MADLADLAEVRKRAWATRREKYGKRGHCGIYTTHGRCGGCNRMAALIVRLHNEGVLTEGQAAKAIGIGRVALRIRADAAAQSSSGTDK
jgi:hypothetical protein